MPQMTPYIIDCDTGRDDALALWSALAMDLSLVGVVASYGNVEIENVIDNTARVLGLAGRNDIPIFAGSTAPQRHHAGFQDVVLPRQAKSGNGLCNVILPPAAREMPKPINPQEMADHIKALARRHGKLDYIILGPATNFANLCDVIGPDIHDVVSRVTMMGGKFDALWDQIPGADFNLLCDPYAVQSIQNAGFKIRFVPMNVTWPIQLPLDSVEALVSHTVIGETAKNLMIAHCKYFAPEPIFRFHDPSVIISCLEPSFFKDEKLQIVCDDQSPDHGRLIRSDDGFESCVFHADEGLRQKIMNQILESTGLGQPQG